MKRFVEIDTPLKAGALLFHRMRAREELGRLSEYELDLLSSDRAINLDAVLGKTVTVKLELGDDKVRSFSGYVTRFSLAGMHGRFHLYHATVRPWLWFLTRTTNCRIFQGKKVPEILKEVFEKHPSVADVKFELTDSYTPWEFCVQYRESDFNFVSRLMENEGIYYFFRHDGDRHTLVLADSSSAHPIASFADSPGSRKQAGPGSIPFIEPERQNRVDREHVSEWSMTHELQPGKYAHTDFDFE
jgi:type VI secretion system secreted protein VgrG